jgi:hypothetical protein
MTITRATTRHAIRHGACLLLLAALPGLALGTVSRAGSTRDVPIPEKKPPPPGKDSTAPTVSIRSADNGDLVEEYRQGGKIFMVRITPKHGKPYYLYDDDRNGRLDRTDADKASVSPVYWTIYEWD